MVKVKSELAGNRERENRSVFPARKGSNIIDYDASQFGRATVPNGAHDILYGVPLVLTSNLPKSYTTTSLGLTNAIVHTGAIAFALGGADFTVKETEHLRKKIIGDTMYGDTILNSTWGVQLMCTSD